MAENVEEIEAKLAAYVDGELTPTEKVEIETHLEANPSHRILLQDLMQHRQLLRALPREKAPGDCTEGFQGQLERDILLGGDELTQTRSRFRIRYSPQLLSAAAIIILAIGLAVVVFSVLPPHHPRAPLAQLTDERGGATEAPGIDTLADTRSYKIEAKGVEAKKGAEVFGGATLALKDGGNQLESERMLAKAKADVGDGLGAMSGTPEMLVITVTAEDLKGANETVVRYLASNNINFTPAVGSVLRDGVDVLAQVQNGVVSGALSQTNAPAPAQLPAIAAAADEVAKREEDSLVRLRAARPAPTAPERTDAAPQEASQQEEIAPTRRPESFAKTAASASPTTQPAVVASSRGDRRMTENLKAGSTPTNPTSTGGSTIAGAAGGGGGGAAAEGIQQQLQLREAETRLGQIRGQQVARSLDLDTDPAGARVILAHNMNGRQVQELATSLRQPERNQWAFVRSNASNENRLSTLWADGAPRQTDHFLEFRAPAQHIEAAARDKYFSTSYAVSAPTTQPAKQVGDNIAADNAGLTREEANVKAGAALNLPAEDRSVTAAFYEILQQDRFNSPTTRPAAQDVFACYIVLQNPPLARGAGAAPATQPFTAGRPTTAPAAAQPAVPDTAR